MPTLTTPATADTTRANIFLVRWLQVAFLKRLISRGRKNPITPAIHVRLNATVAVICCLLSCLVYYAVRFHIFTTMYGLRVLWGLPPPVFGLGAVAAAAPSRRCWPLVSPAARVGRSSLTLAVTCIRTWPTAEEEPASPKLGPVPAGIPLISRL